MTFRDPETSSAIEFKLVGDCIMIVFDRGPDLSPRWIVSELDADESNQLREMLR